MLLERLIQQVVPGKWEKLAVIDKKYDQLESRFGFPPKKRWQALFGANDNNSLIIEREWESLTKLEAAYMALMADPAYQKLGGELQGIITSNRQEIYWELP